MVEHKAKRVEHLCAGWNEVVYGGKIEKAGVAMQSIENKVKIAYYLNNGWVRFCHITQIGGWQPWGATAALRAILDVPLGIWRQIVRDTKLFPGQIIALKVSKGCTWEFEHTVSKREILLNVMQG